MAVENGTSGGGSGGDDIYVQEEGTSKVNVEEAQNTPERNGDEQEASESEAEKKKTADQKVPYLKLFSFADRTDVWLMIFGIIGAVGNGLTMPYMTILLGELINAFGSNQDNDKETVDKVARVRKPIFRPCLVL